MPVGDWLLIDATVDNSVSTAAVDGDDRRVEIGHRVRRAGWAAAASHPNREKGPAGWPPVDADISLDLPMTNWSFVVAELVRWAAVSEQVGMLDERDETARVAERLRTRLADRP